MTKSLSGDLPALDSSISRLFSGSESNNGVFDHLTITVIPEPGSSALAGMAVLGLLRLRRK